MKEKAIIGSTEHVDFGKRAQKVPAKIDTGADSSAVWASNIRIDKDGVLKFSLFGEVRRIIMVRYLRELIIL